MDSYNWFRNLVQDNRKLDGDQLTKVADGRVFTGRQGLELKLVDELGDERQALVWLQKEKGIDPKLRVRNYELEPRLSDLPFLHVAAVTALDAVGLSAWARRIEAWGTVRALERLNLDGLLALWHPSIN
jgi:protease-4